MKFYNYKIILFRISCENMEIIFEHCNLPRINRRQPFKFFILHITEKTGRYRDLMISFSIWSNTKKLTSINNSSGNIKCLNGLRFLSILWIIYHHQFFNSPLTAIANTSDILNVSIY